MADPKNTPVPSKSKIMNILKGSAGLKNLTPNQMKLKLADMGKTNVRNLMRLSGLKGIALTAAVDVAMRLLPEPREQGKGADPLKLFSPKKTPPKKETDKQKIKRLENELAVEKTLGKVVTENLKKKPVRPKLRPKNLRKSLAPTKSLRPKTRGSK